MKCYYYQFELSREVSLYFGIRRQNGPPLMFRRLPMGFNLAPKIAHDFSVAVCQQALGGVKNVVFTVCIDNIFVFGNAEEHLAVAYNRLTEVFNSRNMTVGSVEWIRTEGVILGASYNLEEKTAMFSEAFRVEHSTSIEFARKNWESMSAEQWWRT